MGSGTAEIDLPDTDETEYDRQVLFQRRAGEMPIHFPCPGEQRIKIPHADRKCNRQADCRPQRIASAHPIPELEHVAGIDAEFLHLRTVGGDCNEMGGDIFFFAAMGKKPLPRSAGIGHGFLGSESFRGDDEQRGFRVQPP